MKKRILTRVVSFAVCMAMVLSTVAVYADETVAPSGQPTSVVIDNNIDLLGEGESNEDDEFIQIKPTLSITAGDGIATLKWNTVDGAEYYEIFDFSKKSTVATSVEGTEYTIAGLSNGAQYSYQIRAAKKTEGNSVVFTQYSEAVSVKPIFSAPEKVTDIRYELSNKAVTLTWEPVDKATSYVVYRWKPESKKYVKIGETTKLSYTNKGLTVGKKYYYKIAAVRKSGLLTLTGTESDKITIKANSFVTGKVHTIYYKATFNKIARLYKDNKGKKCVGMIKPGKKCTVLTRNKMMAKVRFSNGKEYWVYKSKYVCTSSIYTTKDYTTRDKEKFVNEKKFKSKTKYLIWISQYTQKVNIFKKSKGKWDLIKTFKVGTGKHYSKSPIGTYKITYKEKGWFYSSTYVKPVVHWCGKNSFHSRIYYNNGKLCDAGIGKPVSNGCVRMYNADINYIYKNMPVGTTVISY